MSKPIMVRLADAEREELDDWAVESRRKVAVIVKHLVEDALTTRRNGGAPDPALMGQVMETTLAMQRAELAVTVSPATSTKASAMTKNELRAALAGQGTVPFIPWYPDHYLAGNGGATFPPHAPDQPMSNVPGAEIRANGVGGEPDGCAGNAPSRSATRESDA